MMIGTTELLLIAGIALLLFGGTKLPEMMRGLGKGVREFKEGMNGAAGTKQDEDADGKYSSSEEPEAKKEEGKK
jgi:sec-independent protein translocase protein TatA